MPTFPNLSSKMLASPITESLPVKPVHFVSLPSVPLPMTGNCAPEDAGAALPADCGRLWIGDCARAREAINNSAAGVAVDCSNLRIMSDLLVGIKHSADS